MKPADPPPDSLRALGAEARLRPLLALLQLASPALPVGGFAYSQGLEKAIEDGLVHDAAGARRWIGDLLTLSMARWEAPLWLRAFDAAAAGDAARLAHWNAELLAARETAELRAETQQMGASLLRVLPALGVDAAPRAASGRPDADAATVPADAPIAFPAAFAFACAHLGVDREAGLLAYLWSWAENQALVAVKSVPLGQQAGQALLAALHGAIAAAVQTAAALGDDQLGSAALGLALASARHETQYSRLYRS
jgi:urease accessory protein